MPPPVHLKHQCEDINSSSVVRNTFLSSPAANRQLGPNHPAPALDADQTTPRRKPDGSVKVVCLSMAPHRRCQKVEQYRKPLLPPIKPEQLLKQ